MAVAQVIRFGNGIEILHWPVKILHLFIDLMIFSRISPTIRYVHFLPFNSLFDNIFVTK